MTYEQHKDLKPEDFKRLYGVNKETFNRMVSVVTEQVEQKKKKSGKPSKLSIENQVLLGLEYWREYRTYFHIACAWGIHEATVCRIVRKVENALIRSRVFKLPGKKQLHDPNLGVKVVVIDATESSVERPKKRQKRFFSGKKGRHTLKSQLVVDPVTKAVVCTTYAPGKVHDFRLFKKSRVKLKTETECQADKGYQGLQKLHSHTRLPKKKPKGGKLSKQEKQLNRALAKERIVAEHVIGKLKVFKIVSERYRNRRKRFGLRFNLIAGLYNYELSLRTVT